MPLLAYYAMPDEPTLKPIHWVASSYDDLMACPREVKHSIGLALMMAQAGGTHPSTKPLKGFRGARVREIVTNVDGNAYRGVYTVDFANAVYVLHIFQKKAKKGIKTPKHTIDLIKQRLVLARQDNRQTHAPQGNP